MTRQAPAFQDTFSTRQRLLANPPQALLRRNHIKLIRHGSYSYADDLDAATHDCLVQHDEKPKPIRWIEIAEDNRPPSPPH